MEALGILNISTYIVALVAIVLLPGPNSLFVLSVGAQKGRAQGYKAAAGVFVGDAILMVLAATGGAALLRATPALFSVVKLAGSAYLGFLGFKLLWAAYTEIRQAPVSAALANTGAVKASDLNKPFKKALIISLLNPKAILFFISFFIQFVDPAYAHPALSFLVLGVIAEFFSFVYLSALIFSGEAFAKTFRDRLSLKIIGLGSVGVLFLAFAVKLATAHLE